MIPFFNLFFVEIFKIRKSTMIWIVILVFTIAPLTAGFFTFLLQEPEIALQTSLLKDKASLLGEATASSYINIQAQMIAVGGLIAYGFVTSWIFGREYVDKTMLDLLVLPYSRTVIVYAKFFAMFVTNLLLTLYILFLGLIIGLLIEVEAFSLSFFVGKLPFLLLITSMTILLSTPFAFFASIGKGYLLPIGSIFIVLIFSQLFAAIGFGSHFPWSVPALLSGIAGDVIQVRLEQLTILLLTSILGMISTQVWWRKSDYHA